MTVFKYKTKHIDDYEVFVVEGLVFAKNYADAMRKLEKYSTDSNGKCDLIGVEELYELENSNGIINIYDIKELF